MSFAPALPQCLEDMSPVTANEAYPDLYEIPSSPGNLHSWKLLPGPPAPTELQLGWLRRGGWAGWAFWTVHDALSGNRA